MKLREAGLFSENKINTKEAADKIAALLTEGSAYTYSVTEEDGKFYVEDPEGEIVKGANTPVGLVDLLNQGTIYAQLDKEDASNAAKYVASRMGNINIKTQTELQKAYDKLKPGESITVNGKTYTKPK
jgi:hypothetical protein